MMLRRIRIYDEVKSITRWPLLMVVFLHIIRLEPTKICDRLVHDR